MRAIFVAFSLLKLLLGSVSVRSSVDGEAQPKVCEAKYCFGWESIDVGVFYRAVPKVEVASLAFLFELLSSVNIRLVIKSKKK